MFFWRAKDLKEGECLKKDPPEALHIKCDNPWASPHKTNEYVPKKLIHLGDKPPYTCFSPKTLDELKDLPFHLS